MEFKDYYKILEVDEKSTPADIKKSYKKLARKYHPDISKEENAEQKFKDLAEAYEVIKNPEKRQEYDQLKAMGGRNRSGQFTPPPNWESATHFYDGNEHSKFSDFFEAMFGHNGEVHRSNGEAHQVRMRGEDVHADLSLFLEDAYKGCDQVIEIRAPEVDERGLISHRSKKLKVKIPPGSANGSILRIRGQGGRGIGDGGAGDLMITIRIAEHPLFSVDGLNLSLVLPVLPWEAALGCKVTVPTLINKTRLTIPANSQTGNKLRLAGLGLPGKPSGDLFVVLKVVMPKEISDKAKALYTNLKEEEKVSPRTAWEENES